MLEVVVDGDDHVVAGEPDAAEKRVVLAVVAHQGDAADPAIPTGDPLDRRPGRVATAVVDDDHLPRRSVREDRLQPIDQLLQGQLRVVGGNHDRDAAGEVGHPRHPTTPG